MPTREYKAMVSAVNQLSLLMKEDEGGLPKKEVDPDFLAQTGGEKRIYKPPTEGHYVKPFDGDDSYRPDNWESSNAFNHRQNEEPHLDNLQARTFGIDPHKAAYGEWEPYDWDKQDEDVRNHKRSSWNGGSAQPLEEDPQDYDEWLKTERDAERQRRGLDKAFEDDIDDAPDANEWHRHKGGEKWHPSDSMHENPLLHRQIARPELESEPEAQRQTISKPSLLEDRRMTNTPQLHHTQNQEPSHVPNSNELHGGNHTHEWVVNGRLNTHTHKHPEGRHSPMMGQTSSMTMNPAYQSPAPGRAEQRPVA